MRKRCLIFHGGNSCLLSTLPYYLMRLLKSTLNSLPLLCSCPTAQRSILPTAKPEKLVKVLSWVGTGRELYEDDMQTNKPVLAASTFWFCRHVPVNAQLLAGTLGFRVRPIFSSDRLVWWMVNIFDSDSFMVFEVLNVLIWTKFMVVVMEHTSFN